MMNRWTYGLLALLIIFSCSKTSQDGNDGPVIEISLETGEPTKAGSDGTQDGQDTYNENLISHVDFFFYPGGNTDAPATYHVRHTSGKRGSDVIRLKFESDEINRLIFPVQGNVRTATVFAVANYPRELVKNNDLSGTSLPSLQDSTVTTDFSTPSSHKQTNFLMSGSENLTLRGRSQVVAAAGSVQLARYAAKLTVGINVASEVQKGDEIWTPMLDGMELYLENGVKKVSLLGEITPTSSDYFSYSKNRLRFAYKDNKGEIHYYFDKDGDYYNTYPTYMYPQRWTYGSTEAPDAEPYLKLVVPWVRKGTTSQQQYYYKIFIPEDQRDEFRRSFQRNNWYHIKVDVGILGTETDDDAVTIPGSCFVLDWQNKDFVMKTAEIGKARYLSVQDTVYNLYNISAPTPLPYVSSHPVTIQNISATRPYYGTEGNGKKLFNGAATVRVRKDGTKYLEYDGTSWLKDTASVIIFTHPLNNDYTTESFDSSPYTVEFDLWHTDDPDHTYSCHQKVIQYPGIYIETTPNKDPLATQDDAETGQVKGKPAHWGYTWVNGMQLTLAQANAKWAGKTDTEITNWKTSNTWLVVYYNTGGRDMVKITVTVLPQEENPNKEPEFIIGDPRVKDKDNLETIISKYGSECGSKFATAPYIDGGSYSLRWYYPTDESKRTVNMIAPAFRISSKHSGTEYDGTGFEQAKLRCASFQENGFPAGRWRLPTKAEIKFASQLSANGVFEWQFKGNYWSAQGGVNVDTGTKQVKDVTLTKGLIRCVYDSWYWGDERIGDDDTDEGRAKLNTFVWADKER